MNADNTEGNVVYVPRFSPRLYPLLARGGDLPPDIPKFQREFIWRGKTREIFAGLAIESGSEWPFSRTLAAYDPLPRPEWLRPGEDGDREMIHEAQLHHWELGIGNLRRITNSDNVDLTDETKCAVELLHRKLLYACGPEANLFDIPNEVMLFCGVCRDADVSACLRLTDFFHAWIHVGAPHFSDADNVESFIAFWVRGRWDASEHSRENTVPKGVQEDIRDIRAFCDWQIPKTSRFAQTLASYLGDPLDEGTYLNAAALRAYLDYMQQWVVEELLKDEEELAF